MASFGQTPRPKKPNPKRIGQIDSIPKISTKKKDKYTAEHPPPPPPSITQGVCDHSITKMVSTEVEHPGRDVGELVIYPVAQEQNYKSLFARYQQSIVEPPMNYIAPENNPAGAQAGPIWQFCSRRSPHEFWNVTIGKRCTFVNVKKPALFVLCPGLEIPLGKDIIDTDCTSLYWSVVSDRQVAFVPSNTVANPSIIILDDLRSGEPIELQVQLPLNIDPQGFSAKIFFIYTVPTSIYDGSSLVGGDRNTLGYSDANLVPCSVSIVPSRFNSAYFWVSGDVLVSWQLPANTQYLTKTIWQQDIGGVYTDISSSPYTPGIPPSNLATATFGYYYRIASVYDVGISTGTGYSTGSNVTYSDTCRFHSNLADPVTHIIALSNLYADDQYNGSSLCSVQNAIAFAIPTQQNLQYIDSYNGSSLLENLNKLVHTDFTAQNYQEINEYDGSSLTGIPGTFVITPQSGVIIG